MVSASPGNSDTGESARIPPGPSVCLHMLRRIGAMAEQQLLTCRAVAQADICQLGNDQRKVNMLAREYCDLTKRKLKPIIVSHAMLPGLKEGQEKMSKSDPDSAIFMEDSAADVKTKIKKAFCPPGVVEGNPCLEYVRAIVLPWCGKLEITRPEDNGGNKYAPFQPHT